MANTKIYRKGGLIILDIANAPNRFHISKVEFELTEDTLKVSEVNSAYTRGIFTVPLSEVQDELGAPVGDYNAVEAYISDLRLDVYK